MKIEVLGIGCPKCRKTKENVLMALSQLGRDEEVIEVKDINAISGYGVMMTPAVVIDGVVKVVGKVPSVEEITAIIAELLLLGK